MNIKIYLLLFLFINKSLYGQIKERSILLLDENNNPVPYATIIYLPNSGGTYSDENGIFTICEIDSLIIHHVSFLELKVKVSDLNDTIVLKKNDIELPELLIHANKYKNRKYHFSKKHKLKLNLLSFEVGTVIPISNALISNVKVPFRPSGFETKLKLKIYSVLNEYPYEVKHEEVITVKKGEGRKIKMMSFKDNIYPITQSLDSIFISIETIKLSPESKDMDNHKNKSIAIFLDYNNPNFKTYATRNFDNTKRWAMFESWKNKGHNNPKITLFLE